MARVLTENQMLLTEYLAAVGCQTEAVLCIMVRLLQEEETLEMLEFCKNNPSANQEQLLSAASKIYSKYERTTEL